MFGSDFPIIRPLSSFIQDILPYINIKIKRIDLLVTFFLHSYFGLGILAYKDGNNILKFQKAAGGKKVIKGNMKNVIIIKNTGSEVFEQAIFILKDEAVGRGGITEELLLKEAKRIVIDSGKGRMRRRVIAGPVWACAGAIVTGFAWLLTVLF